MYRERTKMREYSYYIIIAGGVFLALLVLLLCRTVKNRRRYPDEMDLMEGHELEYFCADLLRRKGFIEVEVTKGSGDYGIDILAEKDGVTYAVQCKCYTAPIGVKAIQEAYAGSQCDGKDYGNPHVDAVINHQPCTENVYKSNNGTC